MIDKQRSKQKLHRGGERPGESGLFLNLASNMASIDVGRVAMLDYLAPFHLDHAILNRLEVIFEELISNIVRHGAEACAIGVELEYSSDGVTLAVEDDGATFNPLDMPCPAAFTTLEDAELGGLGIPLTLRLAKSVSYERVVAGDKVVNRVSAVIAA